MSIKGYGKLFKTEIIKCRNYKLKSRLLLRESYILVYKLVVIRLAAVEYTRVGRTGVNAYWIRIKL